MPIHKKVIAFLVVVLVLIIVFLGGLFIIFNRTVTAPTTNFRGPDEPPYVKGPTTPPPSEY